MVLANSGRYIGDFAEDSTIVIPFDTTDQTGNKITRSALGTIKIYKNGSTTEKVTANGVTDINNFDSQVGINLVTIDTSNDTGDVGFWVPENDYLIMLVDATVDTKTVSIVLGQFSIENRVTDIVRINGERTNSNDAVLKLKQLDITNSDADAHALVLNGNGAGAGAFIKGGTTGIGLNVEGGSTSGNGLNILSANGHAINAVASGGGAGFWAEGVAFGIFGMANGTSGPQPSAGLGGSGEIGIAAVANTFQGALFVSQGANNPGIEAMGNGSAAGFKVTGGATGHGIEINGGSTSGDGIHSEAKGTGSGTYIKGNATGHGVNIISGSTGDGIHTTASVSGRGIYAIGGSSSGSGIYAKSQGTGDGITAIGGATGHGFSSFAEGGCGILIQATTETGIKCLSSTKYGIEARGGNAYAGIYGEGGLTGPGLEIKGGSTSGDGVKVTTTIGNGISIIPAAGNGIDIQALGSTQDSGMYIAAQKQGIHAEGKVNGVLLQTTVSSNKSAGAGLKIIGSQGAGIEAIGDETYAGIYSEGGAEGIGLEVKGGSTSGDAIKASSIAGTGLHITSANGYGILSICTGGNGAGASFNGGPNNGHGLYLQGGGSTGSGLHCNPGTDGNGMTLWGSLNGNGLNIESGITTGNGIKVISKNAAGTALLLTGGVSGKDISAKEIISIKTDTNEIQNKLPIGIIASETDVQSIQNNTRFVSTIPAYFLIPETGDNVYEIKVHFYDTDGNMEDPNSQEFSVKVNTTAGTDKNSILYKEFAASNLLDASTKFAGYKALERIAVGIYHGYIKIENTENETQFIYDFACEEGLYTITFLSDINGTLTGETDQKIIEGEDASPITAVPNTGYHFNNWTGDITSSNNPLTLTNILSNIEATANFLINQYNIVFVSDANGSITGDLNQIVDYGNDCTSVTAVPDSGYSFKEWTGDVTGTNNPLTVLNVTNDLNITATFEAVGPPPP